MPTTTIQTAATVDIRSDNTVSPDNTALPDQTSSTPGSSDAARRPSLQSLAGLNAANFFLAEVVGVVIPFVSTLLREADWSYTAIGVATALAGLGVFVMQTPAGVIVDRLQNRRGLLAAASLVLGLCYGLVPLVPAVWWTIDPLLFAAGGVQAFFVPALGALALALVGHAGLNATMGWNQSWNHAGNLAAALLAIVLVPWLGVESVFFTVTAISVLAALSLLAIRPAELDESLETTAAKSTNGGARGIVRSLLADRRVFVLLASTALFHLANAPVMPLVALDVKRLGGSDSQVALVVLVAQLVMIPVALAAGYLCEHWGRTRLMAVGFVVLPLRIFLYSLAGSPQALIALQTLDGIGAGIYGVAIVTICADLTRGKPGFNTLMGMVATALAVGGVIGPLLSGVLVDHLGFALAFDAFAVVALAAAAIFVGWMPETRPSAA